MYTAAGAEAARMLRRCSVPCLYSCTIVPHTSHTYTTEGQHQSLLQHNQALPCPAKGQSMYGVLHSSARLLHPAQPLTNSSAQA